MPLMYLLPHVYLDGTSPRFVETLKVCDTGVGSNNSVHASEVCLKAIITAE